MAEDYPHRIFIEFPFLEGPREIPVPPENIVGTMEQKIHVVDVISLGEVMTPGGRSLENIQWESHFPKLYDMSIEKVNLSHHYSPEEWKRWIKRAQEDKELVHISIDNTDISRKVVITKFGFSYIPGPSGDVWYQIETKEFRQGHIREYNGVDFVTPDLRGTPFQSVPTSYVTKPKQTLQDISIIVYGDILGWKTIYDANKEAIFGAINEAWRGLNEDPSNVVDDWSATSTLPEGTTLRIPQNVRR